MRLSRPWLAPVVLILAATLVAACGIPHDREPTVTPGGVVLPAVAPSESPTPGGPGSPSSPYADVTLFLVQAEHLVKVGRRAPHADLIGALNRLLAGPREAEYAAGIRTAISPQTALRSAHLEGDTAVIDLSAAFVEVGGPEQILAVAQIVLTATAVPGADRVRLLLEGQAVEVPRADGTLSSESLGAADYHRLVTAAP